MDGSSAAFILRPIGRLPPVGEASRQLRGRWVSEVRERRIGEKPKCLVIYGLYEPRGATQRAEAFMPRELVAAYEDFVGGEPQYLDTEGGIKASAYRFGARVLFVYEESEMGSIVLIHAT